MMTQPLNITPKARKRLRDLHASLSVPGQRTKAMEEIDKWLQKYGKTWNDVPELLYDENAAAAARAAAPDPRDTQPHPFDNPQFTPLGVVHGMLEKYLTMEPHAAVILAAWTVFTHVYPRFRIAPRIALVSEGPRCGKSVALDVTKCLALRSNPELLSTPAAIADFIDQGPCTIGLDELDLIDPEARRTLQLLWNLGYKRGAKRSLMVKGKRRSVNLHAPMIAAGIGSFLAMSQLDRTFVLEMRRYTEETKPELMFDDEHTDDLKIVYAYQRQWATKVKLDPNPAMPPGVLDRDADNARGLVAVADACGPAWGKRVREALVFLLEKARAERPEIMFIRHGLAVCDLLGLDQPTDPIGSIQLNHGLKRLDLPDARWTRYRGPSGTDYAHPIELHEQAKLAAMVGIKSDLHRRPGEGRRGKQFRGYTRGQFEEADRVHGTTRGTGAATPRLRLVPTKATPTSD
jgi:hypothetical protein